MASEKKVATEVAEQEFDRWAEAMDLDFDPKGWDDEDKKTFVDAKNRLVKQIERGSLVVDSDGRFQYTPQQSAQRDPITFDEPDGAGLMAMDQKKRDHHVAKMFATMGAMTGQPPSRFSAMKGRDLKVCQSIYALFLAS